MTATRENTEVHVSTTDVACPTWCAKTHTVCLSDMSGMHELSQQVEGVDISILQGFGNDGSGVPELDPVYIRSQVGPTYVEDLLISDARLLANALAGACELVTDIMVRDAAS